MKQSQIRIAYTVLRVNEIRLLTQNDINIIKASQFNIIHLKNKQSHIYLVSPRAVKDLEKCNTDFKIVFDKYKYHYLFGKEKPVNHKTLIKIPY